MRTVRRASVEPRRQPGFTVASDRTVTKGLMMTGSLPVPDFTWTDALLRAAQAPGCHPDRVRWTAALPQVVADVARRWSLTVGRPFEPGGASSWVAPARDAAGTAVVLKVGWPHAESAHEADALAVWAGDGAVRLLDAVHLEGSVLHGDALLLERCDPGTPLASALAPPEQDVLVAGLLQRLWVAPPADHPFRPLAQMCEAWADEVDGPVDGLVGLGVDLLRSLPAVAEDDVLLATDLHAGNVLAAAREPWLAIDPKPYVGERAYDLVQHLLNHPERLLADARGLVSRVADLAAVDDERVRWWVLARCALSSRDDARLAEVARGLG